MLTGSLHRRLHRLTTSPSPWLHRLTTSPSLWLHQAKYCLWGTQASPRRKVDMKTLREASSCFMKQPGIQRGLPTACIQISSGGYVSLKPTLRKKQPFLGSPHFRSFLPTSNAPSMWDNHVDRNVACASFLLPECPSLLSSVSFLRLIWTIQYE